LFDQLWEKPASLPHFACRLEAVREFFAKSDPESIEKGKSQPPGFSQKEREYHVTLLR
jgi:hypothetical protein